MPPTFNVKNAEKNLMQAIYTHSASFPTPLTPDNCQGEMTVSKDGQKLTFNTNDLVAVLAPMMFAKVSIEDFGSRLQLDEPDDSGIVASIRLKYAFIGFGHGRNYNDFADVRFNADGEIVEIYFAITEHRERMQEDASYAKRFD